jgi:tetratricopeptide (TPR) repeat protein
MSNRQLLLLPVFAVVLIALTYVFVDRQGNSAEANLEQLIAELEGQPSPQDAVAFWESRAAANPNSFIDLTNLGDAHIRNARLTGDVGAYARAEEAYRRALELNPDYYPAGNGRAAALFALHQFDEAMLLAQELAADGRNLTALALIGDIHAARGDYELAEQAYQQVEAAGAEAGLLARRAQLAWVAGDPQRAIRLMREASASADASGDYRENLAWLRVQIGDLAFKSGDLNAAEAAYAEALKIQADSYLALAGMGRVTAARGDLDEAIDFYTRAAAIVPLPDVLAELGDVYATAGDTASARSQYDTVTFIGGLDDVNGVVYNRQLALFYANHDEQLDVALELAKRELTIRHDVYAYDTLAWALYKNGALEDAAEAMREALRFGTRDPLLLYHAGMIEDARGNVGEARALLREAIEINPAFDVLQAAEARAALERLG